MTEQRHVAVVFENILLQAEPGLTSQVGSDENPVPYIGERNFAGVPQMASNCLMGPHPDLVILDTVTRKA